MLSASELTLTYGHPPLLTGASLTIDAGERVGLVGRNGAGKSSLLRLLSGAEPPDSGEVIRARGLRVGYLQQEFAVDNSRNVGEYVAAGAADLVEWMRRYEAGEGTETELGELLRRIEIADGWHLSARITAEASALGLPPLDAPIGPLSGGEKRRVALCRALIGQPDLLLLDEPTNHLDVETIRWLEEFLREFRGALIFVTHDRYFLDSLATRIVEVADGRCYSHPGNYSAYLESKAIRQQISEQTERRRQRFLREELAWVRSGVRAQRSKPRHRLESFYAVSGLEAPPEEREMDLIIPPPPELGNTAIEFERASARAGGDPEARWLFRGLTLSLKPGQCTGIVGRNGVGKTTMLRLCMGERLPDEGEVKIGKQVVFNYIDQARMQLDLTRTVMAEIQDGDESVNFGGQQLGVRSYLRRFLFADDRVRETVGKLSGGERARLMLAKVLKRGGNILVLDEPTNDLDLPSLRMLEEALASFDGTVLVVSHDRYFLDRICDQIVAFEDGVVFSQPGNFSYYLEKRVEREQRRKALAAAYEAGVDSGAAKARANASASGNGKAGVQAGAQASGTAKGSGKGSGPAKPRKLTFKEQRELEGMEVAIQAGEMRVAELEAVLGDPNFYATRAAEAPKILSDLETARADVAKLYARWEELEEINHVSTRKPGTD